MKSPATAFLPVTGLLLGATTWGIVWYPFRLMEKGGLPSVLATLLVYAFATALCGTLFRRVWREFPANLGWLGAIALSAGLSNVSYLVAIIDAEVVRIVLLFYLAPLWTVPLARLILRERLTTTGLLVMLLAVAGAVVMLWRPELGMPLPRDRNEWLGLLAGIAFAACNVFVRGAARVTPQAKALAGCLGVLVVALPATLALGPAVVQWGVLAEPHWALIATVGVSLTVSSIALQYGLTHLSANFAAVILLFELLVAALAANLLAGEIARPQDWIGGAMIVMAGMVATIAEARRAAPTTSTEP